MPHFPHRNAHELGLGCPLSPRVPWQCGAAASGLQAAICSFSHLNMPASACSLLLSSPARLALPVRVMPCVEKHELNPQPIYKPRALTRFSCLPHAPAVGAKHKYSSFPFTFYFGVRDSAQCSCSHQALPGDRERERDLHRALALIQGWCLTE